MSDSNIKILREAIQKHWLAEPSDKAKPYVGKFFKMARIRTSISARVEGNHGTYTVSIQKDERSLSSACSCYIGKGGNCHHCSALAITFLNDSSAFREARTVALEDISDLNGLKKYLGRTTLDSLLKQLRARGITQKALAECIGMSARNLSSVRTSELRNHYYNELGAAKLACLWVLEHLAEKETKH